MIKYRRKIINFIAEIEFFSAQMYGLAVSPFLVKVCEKENNCERSEQLFSKIYVNFCQKCTKLQQFFHFDGG